MQDPKGLCVGLMGQTKVIEEKTNIILYYNIVISSPHKAKAFNELGRLACRPAHAEMPALRWHLRVLRSQQMPFGTNLRVL